MTSNARARAVYAVLVVVLFAAQAAVTWAGLEGLRYEELADFIRNPFWFDHRLVYDGASANVAWYALLMLTYKTLGFSPYASKYLRLALQALSLVCAALLARRWVGDRRGWLPLVAYGLSPTALYFNSFAYGIDLQMFPVVVWLITRLQGTLAAFAIGCLAMLTCLSYPSFLLYVPVLAVLYIWMNRAAPAGRIVRGLAIAGAGFAAPFVAALAYLRNSGAFLTDPSAGGAGVFRGGGGNAMTPDPIAMARAMSQVFQDLFVRGSTYYFELPHVEFSGLLGVAAAWGLLIGALVVGWNWKAARAPLVLAGALCVISLAVPLLSQHLPGVRRSTGFLAGTYVVLACVWAAPIPPGVRAVAVRLGKLACVLLVIHHLIVFVPNVRFVHDQVRTIHDPWFNRYGSPAESIEVWARDWVMQGRPLMCPAPGPCRYAEIYAALAGHMKWNGLGDHPIVAVDPRTGAVTTLDIAAFQSRTIAP
jgi:hypothetical protein